MKLQELVLVLQYGKDGCLLICIRKECPLETS